MIKFWKEDFKYVKRINADESFAYRFFVYGESANYLMNRYDLTCKNVEVVYYDDEVRVYKTHKIKNDSRVFYEYMALYDEDNEELCSLLIDTVKLDQSNWEEYKCNDWYMWDTRWEK